MVKEGAFRHKKYYVTFFLGQSKSQRASKSLYWVKSYGGFGEGAVGCDILAYSHVPRSLNRPSVAGAVLQTAL